MANHKQAKKRNRQRLVRRQRNLSHLSKMRTFIKRLRRAITTQDKELVDTTLPRALSAIGKAKSKGVLHAKTAARYCSRLSIAVNRYKAA